MIGLAMIVVGSALVLAIMAAVWLKEEKRDADTHYPTEADRSTLRRSTDPRTLTEQELEQLRRMQNIGMNGPNPFMGQATNSGAR